MAVYYPCKDDVLLTTPGPSGLKVRGNLDKKLTSSCGKRNSYLTATVVLKKLEMETACITSLHKISAQLVHDIRVCGSAGFSTELCMNKI